MRKMVVGWMMVALSATLAGSLRGAAQGPHFGWTERVVALRSTTNGSSMRGIAVDANGNVFVADHGLGTVSEIVAVNGSIPASNAKVVPLGSGFSAPTAVAVDANGDVFVADSGTNRIKEIVAVNHAIPASPTIRILAPNHSFANPVGVAVDKNGNVFVAELYAAYIDEIVAVGGSIPDSPTVQQLVSVGEPFAAMAGLAVDSHGNVFADNAQEEDVEEFLAVNGVMPANPTRVPVAGETDAFQLSVDPSGDLFIVTNNGLGSFLTEYVAVAGSLPASPATRTFTPGAGDTGIAADASGNVFVANGSQGSITEVNTAGANFGSTAVGTAGATISLYFVFDEVANLPGLPSVETDGIPGLDFTDDGTGTCDTNGVIFIYGTGDTCTINVRFTPTSAGLRRGAAILTASEGNPVQGYVWGIGTAPQIEYLPGTQQVVNGGFSSTLGGLAVDGAGGVYIADSGNNYLQIDSPSNGGYTVTLSQTKPWSPKGMALDGAGDIFVTDVTGDRVVKEMATSLGYMEFPVVGGLSDPQAVTVDAAGKVYIADSGHNRVLVEAPQGQGYTEVAEIGSVISPTALAVDAAGDVYILMGDGTAIVQPYDSGLYRYHSQVAQNLSKPSGMAVDSNGDVFISDTDNNQVLEETPTGTGTYTRSIWMSGLSLPGALAFDKGGNLYIAETGKMRVLKEDYSDFPTLAFPATPQGSLASTGQQEVVVENIGNAPLKVSSVAFPAGFPGTSTCTESSSTNVLPDNGCVVLVQFLPNVTIGTGSTDTFYEHVTITSNNLNGANAVGQINVTGIEVRPVTVALSVNTTTTTAAVPVTASVAVSGASGTPTGSIQFQIDGVATGSAVSLSGGKVSAPITIPAGTHVLTAVYSGNTSYPAKTSKGTTIKSNASKTSSTVTLSVPSSAVKGHSVTIKTTIAESLAGVMPTGTVKIYMVKPGTTTAALAATLTVSSTGTASWTTKPSSTGTYKFYVTYSGDENYTSTTTSEKTMVVKAS